MDKEDQERQALKCFQTDPEWSDEHVTDVKLRINALIWENAPHNITLAEAEKLACHILDCLQEGKVK